MAKHPLTLVGDGIENPANARTMLHAAEMFAAECRFHDRLNLEETWRSDHSDAGALPCLTLDELARVYRPRVAFDNLQGAFDIYGFSLPSGPRPAVLVGNERRGLARAVQKLADRAVELPMVSRRLNCLNVAAAAAVALYYLSRGGGGKMQSRSHPEKRRPEILLLGGADHFELGSSIRSAGGLGWSRLFVEDRAGVWFGCDRVQRSEGRAAARRGRNPIHVIPTTVDRRFVFDEVCVFTSGRQGHPLHRSNLARGPKQLLAFPDETRVDLESEDWERLGRRVTFVHPALPAEDFHYHYRLPVTIVLAEASRQIGRRLPREIRRPPRREPLYDHALALLLEEKGEVVYLDDLSDYY